MMRRSFTDKVRDALATKWSKWKTQFFQDVFLDGMMPLQKTQRLIGEQGTTFEVGLKIWKFFC